MVNWKKEGEEIAIIWEFRLEGRRVTKDISLAANFRWTQEYANSLN
jgi:hypothetical protein